MSEAEGRRNRGRGCGVNRLMPRMSAMKAAFSEDFGQRKTLALSPTRDPGGTGTRNPSAASRVSMAAAARPGGRAACEARGAKTVQAGDQGGRHKPVPNGAGYRARTAGAQATGGKLHAGRAPSISRRVIVEEPKPGPVDVGQPVQGLQEGRPGRGGRQAGHAGVQTGNDEAQTTVHRLTSHRHRPSTASQSEGKVLELKAGHRFAGKEE